MKRKELIEKAYSAFSKFRKPERCTVYADVEDSEFNTTLLSATRRGLTVEQVGTVAWSPVHSMTPEALAYFMPRLIELAVIKAIDRDGDPFFCFFTNSFHKYTIGGRFRLFGPDQKSVMADTFSFLSQNYDDQLKSEGWLEMAQQAVNNWSNT
jgi:hypothetical protein